MAQHGAIPGGSASTASAARSNIVRLTDCTPTRVNGLRGRGTGRCEGQGGVYHGSSVNMLYRTRARQDIARMPWAPPMCVRELVLMLVCECEAPRP
eukprot:6396978-Prymnesium_polylepis.1